MKKSKWTMHFSCASVVAFVLLLSSPAISYAQYVPVRDDQMITDFQTFSNNFDTFANDMNRALTGNTDSLRNIIAAGDPGGVAQEQCARGNSDGSGAPNGGGNEARAYTTGPWASSSAATGIPNSVLNVQVNYSHSLRCILEDMVEWQKLGLSLQIHQLLKNYIADAQTKQLQNQLVNRISAANLNWGQAGNQVTDAKWGTRTNSPVYNTNATQNLYQVKGRLLDHIIDQCISDPASGSPVGSLGINVDWRNKNCAATARSGQSAVSDPFYTINSVTKTTLTNYLNPGDSPKFFDSFNDPATNALGKGSIQTFHNMLTVDADSPLNSGFQLDMASERDMRAQEDAKRLEFQSSGYLNTTECSGTPDDPHCVEKNSTAVTPAGENQRSIGVSAGSGQDQAKNANTLDSGGGRAAEGQTGGIAQAGLKNYDTTGLQLSQTAVNQLVKEFYDTIDIGYFGIGGDSTRWAQATMLQIYDEMKFDPQSTQVIVTSGTAPAPTGYGGI